jgi:hypothetical protein
MEMEACFVYVMRRSEQTEVEQTVNSEAISE